MNERKNIITLQQLLDEDSRKFIKAEIELKNKMPLWINKANSLKLKFILRKYLEQINTHIKKIETFFEKETITYLSSTNRVMHALITESEEKLSMCIDFKISDACLLASIQSINHFKISSYGTAAAFANTLGMSKTAVLFYEFETNEKRIDDRLSQLAEYEINKLAKSELNLIF